MVNDYNFEVECRNFVSPPGYAQCRAHGKVKHPKSGEILNGYMLVALSVDSVTDKRGSTTIELVDGWNFEIIECNFTEGDDYCNYIAMGRMKHPISGEELCGFLSFMASPFGNLTIDSPNEVAEVACC